MYMSSNKNNFKWTLDLLVQENLQTLKRTTLIYVHFIWLHTVCARDCDPYEVKNARWQSEECVPGNKTIAGKLLGP
jgi:hypothetical protein